MMKICTAFAAARFLAVAALLATSALAAPAVSHAAPVNDVIVHSARPDRKAPKSGGAPVELRGGSSGPYLDQLLAEINTRRAMVGTPPIVYIAPDANNAVSSYLADLTPQMQAYRACFHGQNNPVAPGWDYVAAAGIDAEARGEVLACPDTNGFWTTDRIADAWLHSPSHFAELYADWDANAVACGTYGAQRGGAAYETIACVTFRV